MKHVLQSSLAVLISFFMAIQSLLFVHADSNNENLNQTSGTTIKVSEPMTKRQAAERFAQQHNITYEDAYVTLYPEDYKFDTARVYESRGVKTREIMVYLDVSSISSTYIVLLLHE